MTCPSCRVGRIDHDGLDALDEIDESEALESFDLDGAEDLDALVTPPAWTRARGGGAATLAAQRAALARLQAEIRRLSPHVRRTARGYTFASPVPSSQELARRLGLPRTHVVGLVRSVQAGNQLRSRGVTARTSSGSHAYDTFDGFADLQAPACQGASRIDQAWWGMSVYIDSCQTETLLDGMTAVGGLATGCSGLIPHPVARPLCAVIGMSMGLGRGALNYLHRRGGNRGLVFHVPWLAFVPSVPHPLGPTRGIVPWHQ